MLQEVVWLPAQFTAKVVVWLPELAVAGYWFEFCFHIRTGLCLFVYSVSYSTLREDQRWLRVSQKIIETFKLMKWMMGDFYETGDQRIEGDKYIIDHLKSVFPLKQGKCLSYANILPPLTPYSPIFQAENKKTQED